MVLDWRNLQWVQQAFQQQQQFSSWT
jgi:hypothetical protein